MFFLALPAFSIVSQSEYTKCFLANNLFRLLPPRPSVKPTEKQARSFSKVET